LYEIAQTARDIRDRDRVLKFVAVTVRRYFHAAGVSFFELADNGAFSLLYTSNLPKERIVAYQKRPWRIREAIFAPLSKGNSVQIPHLQTKEYAKFRERLLYNTVASWYAIPLQIKNKTLGIMVLAGRKPDAVYESELQFLYTIAGHVAVTLENIGLVNALEKQTQALRKANLQLLEANRVKSRFLATVSHELRTPMNSIIGYSEILQDELDGPLTADQADSVERILRSGRNLLSLINDVLDYSKIEAGKIIIRPMQFILSEALDDALEVILPLAKQKNLTITSDISDPLLTAYADPDRARQVLLNILANAIKFTETGSIHIKIEPREDQALISITDTGIGISPGDLPHLFEEFHQIDSSMSRKFGGTGLGLATVSSIIQRAGGYFYVPGYLARPASHIGKAVPQGDIFCLDIETAPVIPNL
jgi:signal transduction histidine kinase